MSNRFLQMSSVSMLFALIVASSSTAWAQEERAIVIPPVVSEVEQSVIPPDELHAMLVAEILRGPRYDRLLQIHDPPASWNPACLGFLSCLQDMALIGGSNELVAVAVVAKPDGSVLDLAYLSDGELVRRVLLALPEFRRDLDQVVQVAVESLLTGEELPTEVPPEPSEPVEEPAPEEAQKRRRPQGKRRVGWRIALRGGLAGYDALGFVSGGIEVSRRLFGPLFVVGGTHLYMVTESPELVDATFVERLQASMVPVHLGLQVQTLRGFIRPYLGADAVAAQYRQSNDGPLQYITRGFRGRAGVDLVIAKAFAITAHGGAGLWGDEDWDAIDPDLPPVGFIYDVSAGIVITP